MDYDFSFFLVMASLVTGLAWGGHALYSKLTTDPKGFRARREPLLIEYARSFFPVVFIVLI
ncbi:MAG: signal peptidase I, partial [Methylococcales bacterium]